MIRALKSISRQCTNKNLVAMNYHCEKGPATALNYGDLSLFRRQELKVSYQFKYN